MSRLIPIASAFAVAGMLVCGHAEAVQRSFVASFGNDANAAANCTFASPCRSFQVAHGVTDSGGEIIALDAAGYGAITINRSISIIANPGFYAGISVSSGSAVTIATPSINVRLSGLKINGIGVSTVSGVNMTNGSSLTLDNCSITAFAGDGVTVITAARVRVTDSTLANNASAGIYLKGGATADVSNTRIFGSFAGLWVDDDGSASPPTSASATQVVSSQNSYGFVAQSWGAGAYSKVSVSNSTADHNSGAGFWIGLQSGATTATMAVSSSKSTRNGVGFQNNGGGAVFNSGGNNFVNDNGTNVSGVITNVGGT